MFIIFSIFSSIKTVARRILPAAVWQRLHGLAQNYRRKRKVNFGHLRRLRPISVYFGYDRGRPVDRYYIENFVAANAPDIRGRVLEVEDDTYIKTYGGSNVTQADVLDVFEGNLQATIIADLSRADQIPSDAFDCIILTQTLQVIYDFRSALGHVRRILKPGGVVLLTCHGISRVAVREDKDNYGEYWHFTSQSIKHLFEEIFPSDTVEISSFGNVLSATAFLYGLAWEELKREELDYRDWRYELMICVRAVKSNK